MELSEVNDYVIKGTVDVEDVRYYEHNGVDPQGIARAVINNLKGGALEGASTITQQLVRNTALSEEATDITFERKAREAELALEMEKRYSKEEILNMYLNTINYGDGCYGIGAAAQNYFQVPASELSLTQAATLAGIPQSPTAFNPKENPQACLERRNHVLERMLTAGDITQDQYDEAVAKKSWLNPAPDEPLQGIYAYPYFTSYVRDELMKEDNIYGCSYADLFQGGLKIYTTLDVDMQNKAEEACIDQYGSMDEGMDAALVAMDPRNGYVKAIVGGNDFYTDQWNIAVQGGRPSGSTFKVFTLAAAIEPGISPRRPSTARTPSRFQRADHQQLRQRQLRHAHHIRRDGNLLEHGLLPLDRADRRQQAHRDGASFGHRFRAVALPHHHAGHRERHAAGNGRGVQHAGDRAASITTTSSSRASRTRTARCCTRLRTPPTRASA